MRQALVAAFCILAGPALAQQGVGQIPAWNVVGNPSAAQAPPRDATVSQLFDGAMCNTVGNVVIRGASTWGCGSATAGLSPIPTLNVLGNATGGTAAPTAFPIFSTANGWTALQTFTPGVQLSTKLTLAASAYPLGAYIYPPALAANAIAAFNLYAPTFGVYSESTYNGILGFSVNNGPATSLPAALNGISVLQVAGGTSYGIFAPIWNGSATNCPVNGGGTPAPCSPMGANIYTPVPGVLTNEFNTFNNFGPPDPSLPPNRGSGGALALPITMTIAAGGVFQSSIAVQIGQEGSAPNSYLTGIYMNPSGVSSFGIVIDATNVASLNTANSGFGPDVGMIIRNRGVVAGSAALKLQTVGAFNAFAPVILLEDKDGFVNFTAYQNGNIEVGRSGAVAGTILFDGLTSGRTQLSGPAVGTSGVVTLPASTDTLVGRATTDTLTNKTLTSPTIGGTAIYAAATGTPVAALCLDASNNIVKKVGTSC